MARTALSLFGEAYRVVIDADGAGLDPALLSPFIFDLNQTITDGSNSLGMTVVELTRYGVTLQVVDITWEQEEKELLLENQTFDVHINKFLDKLDFYFEDPSIDEQECLAQV